MKNLVLKNDRSSLFNSSTATFILIALYLILTTYLYFVFERELTLASRLLFATFLILTSLLYLYRLNNFNFKEKHFIFGCVILIFGFIGSHRYIPNNDQLAFVCDKNYCKEILWRNPLKYPYAFIVDRDLGSDIMQVTSESKNGTPVTVFLIPHLKIADKEKFLQKVAKLDVDRNINDYLNWRIEEELIFEIKRYVRSRAYKDIKLTELEAVLNKNDEKQILDSNVIVFRKIKHGD